MNYQDFCGEGSILPTPYIRVLTKISKWKKYDCIEIDEYKYICGYNDEEFDLPSLYEFVEIDNSSFFWALMALYSDLSPQLFTSIQPEGNAAITDKDIELIKKFCNTYGLPFWNKQRTHTPFANISDHDFFDSSPDPHDEFEKNILRNIIPVSKYNLFPISSFTAGLKSLRYDFLSIINYYKWYDDVNISRLLTPKDRKNLSNMENHSKVHLYTPSLVNFPTYWDGKKLSLSLNCENLMHLFIYHLCLLMQSGTLGSGIIKTCPKCHKQFVANRKNQKFCYAPCTPQSFHMQKKRSNNL